MPFIVTKTLEMNVSEYQTSKDDISLGCGQCGHYVLFSVSHYYNFKDWLSPAFKSQYD